MKGVATVEGKIACEAIVMCALTNRQPRKPAAAPPDTPPVSSLGESKE
jgi:hypothetical protein